MFEVCIVSLWDLGTKKIGAEVFGELRNVGLEDNGEDNNGQRKQLLNINNK